MQLDPTIKNYQEQLSGWRRHLHQWPEPSLKEFETANYIRQHLTEWGVDFQIIGETGTLAVIKGQHPLREGQAIQTVLLRADIDALEITEKTNHDFPSKNEGVMHACGHDSHTAALLGAVHYLKEQKESFAGTIYFAFQQAEEIGAGAKQFIQSGAVNDIDTAFGIHVEPTLPLGKVQAVPGATLASCDIFAIEIEGKSSHVARPNEGIDALMIGANIVTKLQQIASRVANPLEPVVVGIGKFHSGTRYNIVANNAKIEGTLRTLSHESREKYLQLIQDIVEQEASLFGAKASIKIHDAAPPSINDGVATERIQQLAKQRVGDDNVVITAEPSMGADDFAEFLKIIPGVYIRVGVSSSPETSYGVHHEKFDLDERALPLMVQLHVDYALASLAE